ncbi:MAG: hypothetical protein F4Z20_07950 [Gammaproteobacteria bacterium]|nr:hypothetical protein [Gammaproteobacteria bacterium]
MIGDLEYPFQTGQESSQPRPFALNQLTPKQRQIRRIAPVLAHQNEKTALEGGFFSPSFIEPTSQGGG